MSIHPTLYARFVKRRTENENREQLSPNACSNRPFVAPAPPRRLHTFHFSLFLEL